MTTKQMRFGFPWSTALMLALVGSQQIMLLEQEYHIELEYGKGKYLCWHIEMDMRRNRISQFDVETKREKNRSVACEHLIRQRVIHWNMRDHSILLYLGSSITEATI